MEDLLDSWPGTLIVVSHDRYLLERVTDQQYGDARRPACGTCPAASTSTCGCARSHAAQTGALQFKPAGQAAPGLSGADLRHAEGSCGDRTRLQKLDGQIGTAHQRLAEHDQGDFEGLQRLTGATARARRRGHRAGGEWLELSESLG